MFSVLEEEKAGCLNFFPETDIAVFGAVSSSPSQLPSLAGDRENVVWNPPVTRLLLAYLARCSNFLTLQRVS